MAGDQTLWRERLIRVAVLSTLLVAGLAAAFAFGIRRDEPKAEAVAIGGPFTLAAHDGSTLSDTDLKGTPFAVFFGFTHCPEVCPTTLWEMSEALKQLGPDADRLKVLFVTVDPQRDTPQSLATYLQSFDRRIVGLSGTPEQIETVAKAYRAYWRKVPVEGGDYTMDHTASVYLMDAAGRFHGTIAYEEQAGVRLDKLRRLLSEGS
jgi:protein SCO1/2